MQVELFGRWSPSRMAAGAAKRRPMEGVKGATGQVVDLLLYGPQAGTQGSLRQPWASLKDQGKSAHDEFCLPMCHRLPAPPIPA